MRDSSGRLRRALALLVLGLAWPATNKVAYAECSNGLDGVESYPVCCFEGCGVCGGSGCSDIPDTRGDEDCCVATIVESGIYCGVNGAIAPCIISSESTQTPATTQAPLPTAASPTSSPGSTASPTADVAPSAKPSVVVSPTHAPSTEKPTAAPENTVAPSGALTPMPSGKPTAMPILTPTSMPTIISTPSPSAAPFVSGTCSNGIPGHESGGVCCANACGTCGGTGCDSIPGTNGGSDCCVTNILNSGVICGTAPCIISDGTPAPIPPPTAAPVRTVPATQAPQTKAPTTAAPVAGPPTQAPAVEVTTAPAIVPTPEPSGGDGDRGISITIAPLSPPIGDATSAPVEDDTESECSNGTPGFQHGVVCCPVSCGQCGGSGCESIEGTNGASDCCSDVVLASEVFCNTTTVAPCVIGTADDVAAETATSLGRRLGVSAFGVFSLGTALAVVCGVVLLA